MKIFLISFGLMLILSTRADAKAHFQTRNEMIQNADAIAIVSIENVKPSKKRGKFWTYQQGAQAQVETILKGALPSQIMIYGKENFECAQSTLEKGRFLVFLKKERAFWIGSNWQFSFRPIHKERVEWYKTNDNGNDLIKVSLLEAVQQIQLVSQ